jgi:predicted RNA-binding protein YlqC (UPF0109 family)
MQELFEYLARELVDEPDQVQITPVRSGSRVTYEVRVARDDLGKVIGKSGRIANALRALAKAASTQGSTRATVEIVS